MKIPQDISIRYSLLSCTILVFLTSCLDRIELDIDNGGIINVAVDARLIFGDPSRLEVSLSEVFDFDGSKRLILAKSVTLISDTGESVETFRPIDGLYSITMPGPETDFVIDPNAMYKISIRLASDEILESNYQNITRVPKDNKLSFETYPELFENDEGLIVERTGINFISETTLPADDGTKLKWEFRRTFKFSDFFAEVIRGTPGQCMNESFDICQELRNDEQSRVALMDCDQDGFTNAVECDKQTNPRDAGDFPKREDGVTRSCYLTGFVDIPNVKIFDPASANASGPTLVQDIFQPKVNFTFAEGYFVRLITESINKETYTYFEEIETVLSLSGSMFDPPAAKILGNITNVTNPDIEAFGLFYATERDTQEVFVTPEMVGKPDTVCLAPFPGPPPNYCIDCKNWARDLKLEGILKPDFWPADE